MHKLHLKHKESEKMQLWFTYDIQKMPIVSWKITIKRTLHFFLANSYKTSLNKLIFVINF